MQISEWSVLLLVLKLANYFAVAALAGNIVLRIIMNKSNAPNRDVTQYFGCVRRWQLALVSIGLIASIFRIPIEAGAMAETGITGMFDKFMLDIVWQSVIKEQAVLKIPALILGILAVFFWRTASRDVVNFNFLITVIALIGIAFSFTMIGHNASESMLVRSALIFHIIAMASWVGALWPLYKSCKLLAVADVKNLMHWFGQLAIIIIVVLLTAGLILLLQSVNSLTELFTTNYGKMIVLKLLLVTAMLMLGAWHKLQLVPKLADSSMVETLSHSILFEFFIALLVLITTSIFTKLIGI